jgi:hypothetical protein
MIRSWTAPARLLLVAVCAIALARAAVAEGPSTQTTTQPTAQQPVQPSQQILDLVKDLSSDQFAVRQKAQHDLEQMGQSALPQLQAILATQLPDEARTRVGAATRRIVDEQLFGPSVITIHCTDAPLEGVMQDFAHQAGADLGVGRPEIRAYLQTHKISLNLDHANFWTALQAVEDGSGLHARPDTDGRMILDNMVGFWMGQMGDRSVSTIAGSCLIVLPGFNVNVEFRRGGNVSNLNLNLNVMVEPKLRVVGGIQPGWLRECIDDKGHSLIPPNMPGGFFGGGPRQMMMQLGTNLNVVPGMSQKIARLKGVLMFDVQTKSEALTVDNILTAQNVTQKVAGSTFTVEKFTKENNQYRLHISVTGPMAAPNSSFIQNAMYSQIQILDDNDQPLQQMGSNQNYEGSGRANLTIFYLPTTMVRQPQFVQPVGVPRKLRCEFTTESRRISAPFEFDDVSLAIAPEDKKQ